MTACVDSLKFCCTNEYEKSRAQSWRTKEPGTIEWLDRTIKIGDHFWDIGANIGVYAIYAAKLGAEVIAFEPHIPNAAVLVKNVTLNEVADRVKLVTAALGSKPGWSEFNYKFVEGGRSGHQLGHCKEEFTPTEFKPEFIELKQVVFGSDLSVPAPTVIKLDVDGNELDVLKGIDLYARSVQVEVHPRSVDAIDEYMVAMNYERECEHYTALGRIFIDKGGDPAKTARNIVYRRK